MQSLGIQRTSNFGMGAADLRLSERTALSIAIILAIAPYFVSTLFLGTSLSILVPPLVPGVFALVALGPLAIILRETIVLLTTGADSPLSRLRTILSNDHNRLTRVLLLAVLIIFVSQFFTHSKQLIPSRIPFYLDPILADLEYRMLLGNHAWEFTHAIINDAGTVMIDRAYISWFAVLPVTFFVVFMSKETSFQFRAIYTLFFIWIILGVVLATAMSSVGPVFYHEYFGGGLYDPLLTELARVNAMTPLLQAEAAEWLLAQRKDGAFGAGISAMPSIHVALAWFFFLLVRDRLQNPAATALALAFAMLTLFGSVHLAWHYALDGLFSIIAVSLFWRWMQSIEVIENAPAT